jgi:hypothetical protein
MTKKDYIKMASMLNMARRAIFNRPINASEMVDLIEGDMVRMFMEDSPRFDGKKFRLAASESAPVGQFCKVRFKSGNRATAGLVFNANAVRRIGQQPPLSVGEISCYFPAWEAMKMKTLEISPVFNSWNEAFYFEFTSCQRGLQLRRLHKGATT